MSEKVKIYLILDLIGVGTTLIIRAILCSLVILIPETSLQMILLAAINIITICVLLFILFFFLLYWWSDKKWTAVKQHCNLIKKLR